jgi:hypothetical protein
VGEGGSNSASLHEAKCKVLEATDRRRRLNRVMGGPGRKLGGGTETKRMTTRGAAAWVSLIELLLVGESC